MKKLLISLIMCLFALNIYSCKNNLTPLESASISVKELRDTYKSVYDNYLLAETKLSGDNLQKLYKAKPYINNAKKYLIMYNDFVIKWKETGVSNAEELLKNKKLMKDALMEASNIIMMFFN